MGLRNITLVSLLALAAGFAARFGLPPHWFGFFDGH
jgi:hypothetical protein